MFMSERGLSWQYISFELFHLHNIHPNTCSIRTNDFEFDLSNQTSGDCRALVTIQTSARVGSGPNPQNTQDAKQFGNQLIKCSTDGILSHSFYTVY